MLLLLVLASHAAAEWVEISQNHYRKEPPRRVTFNLEETTEVNRIYPNYSMTERGWRGDVTRIPHVGNVKRVHAPNTAETNLATITIEELSGDRTEYLKPVKAQNVREFFENGNVKGKPHVDEEMIEKFERYANSKKFHDIPSEDFNTSGKKTPEATNFLKENTEATKSNKFQEFNIFDDLEHKIIIFDSKAIQNKSNKRAQTVSDKSHMKAVQLMKDSEPKLLSKEIHDEIDGNLSIKDKINNAKFYDIISKHKTSENTNEVKLLNFNKHIKQETVTENASNIDTQSANEEDHGNHGEKLIKPDQKYISNENTVIKVIKNSNNNKLDVIWKLMKLVTDTISRNARRSFGSKVRYLEDLRNNLLANIEQRIEQAWPDRTGARARRAARGHVEFPSSESALMTISFLTFAVFLIKLVLQVIHTYKNKTMMVTPALVAAVGRAAASLRRDVDLN